MSVQITQEVCLATFQLQRDETIQENALWHQRLMQFISLQAVLFVTVGILFLGYLPKHGMAVVLGVFGIIGTLSTIYISVSYETHFENREKISKWWHDLSQEPDFGLHLPTHLATFRNPALPQHMRYLLGLTLVPLASFWCWIIIQIAQLRYAVDHPTILFG